LVTARRKTTLERIRRTMIRMISSINIHPC
jgi:hypothetical protein